MKWSQNLTSTFNHANAMSLRARLPRFVAYTKRTTNQSENSVSLMMKNSNETCFCNKNDDKYNAIT